MKLSAAAFIALASVAWAGGSACAMNSEPVAAADCVVEGGEKLPPETGGAAAICAAIKDALKSEAGTIQVRVDVKSNAWLVARIERDGIALPDQNMAVSDGKLGKGSIERFARAIAQAVATAG
ncbi:MAG TPA: hypothetical protein VFK50_12255 [Sphingomicrobium sp.]|nr:hypothetical protein [Sphingomicrobium sp.]